MTGLTDTMPVVRLHGHKYGKFGRIGLQEMNHFYAQYVELRT